MSVRAGRNAARQQLSRNHGAVLLVGNDSGCYSGFSRRILDIGFDLLTAAGGAQGIALLETNRVHIIFVQTRLQDMTCNEFVRQIRAGAHENDLPIVILASESDDGALLECLAAGADDFLNLRHAPGEFNARIAAIGRLSELRNLYRDTVHDQLVAKQILSAALSARSAEIQGMQVMSRSAAVFSGDLVLSARSPRGGLSIMLADFTGHGMSAAVGVLPVAEMFSVMTEKGFSPEVILGNINNKLITLLPSGMFMAACVVQIDSASQMARVLNCGMPDMYLVDTKAGQIEQRLSSRHIPLGISNEAETRMEFEEFDIAPDDCFVMCSDGLTEAFDSSGKMFGTARLEQIIESQGGDRLFGAIKDTFTRFTAGRELSDDATLVTVPCGSHLHGAVRGRDPASVQQGGGSRAAWRFMIEVSGTGLQEIDPVRIIMEQYRKLDHTSASADRLQSVLGALYDNALNHGVLEVSQLADPSLNQADEHRKVRNRLFEQAAYGFIRVELEQVMHNGKPCLLVRLEDSGRGFDHARLTAEAADKPQPGSGRTVSGIPLIKSLCESLNYHGKGNRVEVVLGDPDPAVIDA